MQTTKTNVFENKHQSSKNVVFHYICVNQFQVGHLTFYGPNSFFHRFSGHNLR